MYGSGLLLPWSAKSAASGCSGYICDEAGVIISYPGLHTNGFTLSSTRLYNLEELPRYMLAGGIAWKDFGIGYYAEHLHHPDYQETNHLINVSYGRSSWRIGANMRNLLIGITGEDMRSAVLCDLGMSWGKSVISTAFSWLNVSGGEIGNEELPVYFIWETNWKVIASGGISIRLEKEAGYEFHPVLAGTYQIREILKIIGSYSREPETVGCGFEITYKKMRISWGLQYHSDLEESHYISINYALSD